MNLIFTHKNPYFWVFMILSWYLLLMDIHRSTVLVIDLEKNVKTSLTKIPKKKINAKKNIMAYLNGR